MNSLRSSLAFFMFSRQGLPPSMTMVGDPLRNLRLRPIRRLIWEMSQVSRA